MTARKPPEEHKKRGRVKGSTNRRETILSRRKGARMIENNMSPMDVMMTNVRFWQIEVGLLEVKVRHKMSGQKDADGNAVTILELKREGVVSSYFQGRDELQTAAEKLAPYIHPRMSPMDPTSGGVKDLSLLTDKELDDLEHIARKISVAYGDPGGKTSA